MAKSSVSSPLEDLDLNGEEIQRLTSAFKDPEFQRMFAEYAKELTDPENRRRYEEEITALERERGVEVRFVHPQPGYVLRTSLDGERRCFVNVCSNELVGAPSSRPGPGSATSGSEWSLPYSLAPGREYAGGSGTRYTVYDVVFHPDALALARRHARFRQMLDITALEAVERQFGVTLDCRNAKTLKIKYKGTPDAAVLRTPLPGGAPARPEGEPERPFPTFPNSYQCPAAVRIASEGSQPQAPSEAVQQPAPTEPRYSVVQRHHVDLQDYRCSRDSAPSPVPQELVVTIELPLLRSADQAALEVTDKLLCLETRKPDYRLRLSLPYPVYDSRGKAQFNKARRQLVVTLPVAQAAVRLQPASAPEEPANPSGTDGTVCASTHRGKVGPAAGLAGGGDLTSCEAEALGAGLAFPGIFAEELDSEREEQDFSERAVSSAGTGKEPPRGEGGSPGDSGVGPSPGDPTGGATENGYRGLETPLVEEGSSSEPFGRAMGFPGTKSREPMCPPLQCSQDEESLTLLIQVPRIRPQSLQGDVNSLWYKLCFSTQDLIHYSLLLQFAPENKLSTREPVLSISSNNVVIQLAKSPESRGHWREWYYGLNDHSLELQECSNSFHHDEKEERVNEGSHVTEKKHTHCPTTSTADSNLSVAVQISDLDRCGSAACLQQESFDISHKQPESKMKPETMKKKSATYSNEGKDHLKEPVTEEKKLDGDHLSSSFNKTTVDNIPGFDNIKETNLQDGSVQIIKDHITHCAFSFQNSLLYDLD
ncbi:protein kintoun isoform X2 [Erinaceus europaeus]|uniref:Protein kintoun n=1 Tax=Erinaceus europaeus TaxID=9365 RepID=A0ABM3W3B2_ERIEU|nr:protein kintoun isoform X2 [Erinaceus europaeus]